ncbi:Phage integrase family protein [Burkholderia sp. WP9]|nr:Phage integrase family protein [Burkholderia sp. WP9]
MNSMNFAFLNVPSKTMKFSSPRFVMAEIILQPKRLPDARATGVSPFKAKLVPAHVFLNRCGQPITCFGIHTLVEPSASRACTQIPSLESKRVSPHTVRHSTVTALLLAGVDINTIRGSLDQVALTSG